MGKLLDMGIAASSITASPTFQYLVADYADGTITVYKNGSVIATLTANTAPTSVTVVNGDTIRMTWTGTLAFNIQYFINAVLNQTFNGATSIDTGTKTIASNNAFKFQFNGTA
jgi:plastocyanin